MEEQALFFEDRKGNINSKKRKRDKRNQNANNLNSDVGKTFSPKDKILQDQLSDNPPAKRQAIFNNNSPHSYQGRKVVENSRYYKEDYKGSQNREYNRGTESDSYSRKNNYQEQNYNDSEKKEKDKKLIELVSYYEKILQTLNGGLTNEDSDIFVSNVLQESEGYEVKLSCHRFSSHCIELLLSVSQDPAISQQFMTAFAKEKEEVVTNANASHITELLLNIAIQNIKNWSSIMEADEDNPEKEHVSYFISWISDLAEFIIENFDCCLQNQYTCHVVCTAIRALGGDMSATTEFMSKKSVEHKKNFREQYSNEETFKAKQPIAPIVLESVPKFFTKLLKKMAKALLNLENIVDYVTDSSSATVIQTLMCILKKRIPKRCRKLISKLATLIFSEKNDNGVPKAFLHRNCSFVVEKMFETADEELQCTLWNEYIVDSLEFLVSHPVGNYIVQKLFNVVESKALFELMNEKVGSMFEGILSSRFYGIFLSIADTCNRLKIQQAQFTKNIMQCLQCLEPEEKQIQLVPRALGFLVDDQPKLSICLQGSLLVQALLKFQKPIKIVNSLLNMKPQDLKYLACHVQGCHVLNAFFASNVVGEKSKDKLIQSMKSSIADIASDRNGSLTMARIWMLLSLKQKKLIIETLGREERTLKNNPNANTLMKKFGIFYFRNNIEQWREMQNNFSKTNSCKKKY